MSVMTPEKEGLDIFILKDEFDSPTAPQIVDYKAYTIRSQRPNSVKETDHQKFTKEYLLFLNKHLPKKTVDRMQESIEEILTNIEDHAHHYDPKKVATVKIAIFDTYACVYTQGEGPGYDVRNVRTSCINPDGTIYMGKRGRGHSYLNMLCDKAFTADNGRGWQLVFKKDAA